MWSMRGSKACSRRNRRARVHHLILDVNDTPAAQTDQVMVQLAANDLVDDAGLPQVGLGNRAAI